MKFLLLLTSALSVAANRYEKPPSYDKHTCLSHNKLEASLTEYIAAFSGITDGGKQVKKTFDTNFKLYSQSTWWTSGHQDVVKAHAVADDFPPVFKSLADFITTFTYPANNPNLFIKGPVAYGCNTFTFYWKGDFSVPGGTPSGRTNGIDIVFLDGSTGKITKAFSEWNTLNQAYNWGSHITWSTNPTCCECPTVFDPSCKCPAAK
ncbi:hypothetical protein G7046_g793 [Stylonectria norvegica]|nr:hypothetical protein G7046_g793 [Stylonectria norvegica]